MNPGTLPDVDRPLGMNRLAMINIPSKNEGIMEKIIDTIHSRGGKDLCPHIVKVQTSVVNREADVHSDYQTTLYFAISENNQQLDSLITAAGEVDVEKDSGSLSVLGRSPFNRQRLSIEELRGMVRQQSLRGIPPWCNLIVAAVLAAVGLAVDSSATVVASMLVSPLMCPLLQISFAAVDPKLRREKGFISGAICDFSLAVFACVAVGFLVGGLFTWQNVDTNWGWPTNEMGQRTHPYHTLAPGVLVAIVSGIGVANGLRNNGVNALVGVAISASLLPPLVNTGMFVAWGHMRGASAQIILHGHTPTYAGFISFLLTMINVAGVLISASFWLWVRGVGYDNFSSETQEFKPMAALVKRLTMRPEAQNELRSRQPLLSV